MRLLIDMNLSPRWVSYLSDAGFEAEHWSKLGPGDATDRDVMAWATQHGAVVLTADLDFSAILAATGEHRPSVVQVRADLLTPEAIGRAVADALTRLTDELDAGAVVTLDPHRARVRVLPFDE